MRLYFFNHFIKGLSYSSLGYGVNASVGLKGHVKEKDKKWFDSMRFADSESFRIIKVV